MKTFLGLLIGLLLACRAEAVTVVATWNASVDPVDGYRLYYGTSMGSEIAQIDVGPSTTGTVVGLFSGSLYFFHVRAYRLDGAISVPSNEVSILLPGDPCAFPLGSASVSIFVTGKLNKTGSGGPGSRAYINFQAASPNSPIVYLSIRANGVDIPDSIASATGPNDRLNSPGSLWFTIPTGVFSYSAYGRNAAGCDREQATGFKTP